MQRCCVYHLDCTAGQRHSFFRLPGMLPLAAGIALPKAMPLFPGTAPSNGWLVLPYKHPASLPQCGAIVKGPTVSECPGGQTEPLWRLHHSSPFPSAPNCFPYSLTGAILRAPSIQFLQAYLLQRACFLKDLIYYRR